MIFKLFAELDRIVKVGQASVFNGFQAPFLHDFFNFTIVKGIEKAPVEFRGNPRDVQVTHDEISFQIKGRLAKYAYITSIP